MKLIVFILTVFFFLHTTSLAHSVEGKLDAFISTLINYQRIITSYGTAKDIRNLDVTRENGKTVQTIEAIYPVGSLLYHVTKNAKGQIDFISIERK